MCLELTHASNIRFMHFEACNASVDAREYRKVRVQDVKLCVKGFLNSITSYKELNKILVSVS